MQGVNLSTSYVTEPVLDTYDRSSEKHRMHNGRAVARSTEALVNKLSSKDPLSPDTQGIFKSIPACSSSIPGPFCSMDKPVYNIMELATFSCVSEGHKSDSELKILRRRSESPNWHNATHIETSLEFRPTPYLNGSRYMCQRGSDGKTCYSNVLVTGDLQADIKPKEIDLYEGDVAEFICRGNYSKRAVFSWKYQPKNSDKPRSFKNKTFVLKGNGVGGWNKAKINFRLVEELSEAKIFCNISQSHGRYKGSNMVELGAFRTKMQGKVQNNISNLVDFGLNAFAGACVVVVGAIGCCWTNYFAPSNHPNTDEDEAKV